jgi:2-polyprenyl-3-methyl-5-hydroxy-6-metoxy-1,4-benzoquinol methylase
MKAISHPVEPSSLKQTVILKPESFDSYSKNYNELLNHSIRHTGYDADDLVSTKLHKLRSLFPSLSEKPFRLLDFGCGVGNLYGQVAEFFPTAIYTGVDPSKDSIIKAHSFYHCDANFQEDSCEEWETNEYDLIFASGVFHHIPHVEHTVLIDKLSSLLKKGGILVIWEHNPLNPVTKKIVRNCPFDKDAVFVPSKNLKSLFTRVSLSNVQVIYTTFFPKFLSTLNFMDPYLAWLPLGGQYIVTGQKN